jgi:hypothetical protein
MKSAPKMGSERIRALLAAAFALVFAHGGAFGQTCGALPNNLQNNTTADATQVMANFNALLACINSAPAPRGYIAGLTLANDANSGVIDTSTGVATSDDQTLLMTLTSAFSKNVSAAWSVGSGTSIGCLDTGTFNPNGWYHVFVIERTDTGAVDQVCSANATTPTLPANYTKKRRIGSFKTSSGQVVPFTQIGDEFTLKTPVPDVTGVSIGTGGRTTLTLSSVPSAVNVIAIFQVIMYGSTFPGDGLWFTTMDQLDAAQISGQVDIYAQGTNQSAGGRFWIHTNTNQQIGARAAAHANTINIATNGWIDTRGRFN